MTTIFECTTLLFGVLSTNQIQNLTVGDVLKAAGWRTPALNKARGNILE